jgi:hypothetical protein
MSVQVQEHNDIFIMPMSASEVVESFIHADEVNSHYTVSNQDSTINILDGNFCVVEIIKSLVGGCVVRVGAALDYVFSIDFVMAHDNQSLDEDAIHEKIGRAMEYVMELGGLEAAKRNGKWRPISEEGRQFWKEHAMACNIQNMRAKADYDKLESMNDNSGSFQKAIAA